MKNRLTAMIRKVHCFILKTSEPTYYESVLGCFLSIARSSILQTLQSLTSLNDLGNSVSWVTHYKSYVCYVKYINIPNLVTGNLLWLLASSSPIFISSFEDLHIIIQKCYSNTHQQKTNIHCKSEKH